MSCLFDVLDGPQTPVHRFRIRFLGEIAQLHGLADLYRALCGLEPAGDEVQQRRLAHAIAAQYAHAVAAQHRIAEVIDIGVLIPRETHMVELYDLAPEARAGQADLDMLLLLGR